MCARALLVHLPCARAEAAVERHGLGLLAAARGIVLGADMTDDEPPTLVQHEHVRVVEDIRGPAVGLRRGHGFWLLKQQHRQPGGCRGNPVTARLPLLNQIES